jgi:hypothetical protein
VAQESDEEQGEDANAEDEAEESCGHDSGMLPNQGQEALVDEGLHSHDDNLDAEGSTDSMFEYFLTDEEDDDDFGLDEDDEES